MGKRVFISLLAAGCCFLFTSTAALADHPAGQQQEQDISRQPDQKEPPQASKQNPGENHYSRQLMTPDQLQGMKVRNPQGEEVGTVDTVVLDSKHGSLAFIVVTSGGFWGIGGEKAVIPWKALKLQQGEQKATEPQEGETVLLLDVDKDRLRNAPQGEMQGTLDLEQARQIHRYYGVSPYWEGEQEEGIAR